MTILPSPEVAAAQKAGQPIVALESTIISHGMPFPQNLETAQRVQAEVRAHGAVPATIAVMGGQMKVGLSDAELEALARLGAGAVKVSRRDLPFVVALGQTGATTVAATMIIAAMAGIRVFAPGGIGGVHRGGAQSLDVSADLQELAQTPVAVVCAGAKSILDLPLTLEYLETHGVPVIGYQTDVLPAFYCRESDCRVSHRLDSAEAIAHVLRTQWALGLRGGAVIANPIPAAFAMLPAVVDQAIQRALAEADQQGVAGKAVTPFLLARVSELTGGESLVANIELVLNNARLASTVARHLR
ncbi:MAG: pseudouridine-5'-phosphate glycosidase [Rhodoferax sp.]